MSRNVARFSILGVIAVLVIAATTGCFFGGGEEPEPTSTPDLAATIAAAAVAAAVPTETPIPPTNTPEPPTPEPTPDLAATVTARLAAAEAARPTATPVPTPTPMPTSTPEPTAMPAPTAVPTSTPIGNPASQIPCVVVGIVTDAGEPVFNAPILAISKDGNNRVVADARSDRDGRYQLSITEFDQFFDIFIGSDDTGVDTPRTSTGCREIRNLNVPN